MQLNESDRATAPAAANPDTHIDTTATALESADHSVIDTLGRHLGRVPWWLVSGAFHLIALVLVVLIFTDIPRETVMVFSTSPESQIKLPPVDPPKPIVHPQLRPEIPLDSVVIEEPTTVLVEPVPEAPVDMTDNNLDSQSTKGDLGDPNSVAQNNVAAFSSIGIGGPPGKGGPSGDVGIGGPDTKRRYDRAPKDVRDGTDIGLAWLAKHQEPDGHWDTVKYGAQESGRCDTAATGLAILAFLGSGSTDRRGEHKDTVKRGLEWIIAQQNADGCVMPGRNGKEASYGPGYHHAICGLALSEAYGMSRSAWLKDAAQKAVNYSVEKHQDGAGSERKGWRYNPKSAGDISVTGWFIMQLKDARLAGLAVPQEAFQGGVAFLDSVEVKADPSDPYSGNRFKYTPATAAPAPMTTMIGCTARMFLGWPREELQPAIDWAVAQHGLPHWGNNGVNVDWYYLYYGTMASFQMGGDSWIRWKDAMVPMLVDNQRKDGDEKGSWDATGHYAHLGRVFSTANAALSLEVFWRISPLYGKH